METFTWRDELLASIHGNVEQIGWSLVGVHGGPTYPSWTYTIGLIKSFDHPELIVVGLPPNDGGAFLNELGERIKAGVVLAAGDELDAWDKRWRLAEVHPSHWTTDRFAVWVEYHGTIRHLLEPRALQVVWPDEAGNFPGEPGWNHALDRARRDLSEPATEPPTGGWYDS
jgi:hypothetical protein